MIGRIVVLLLAISQPIVAYMSVQGNSGSLMMNGSNPLITPAGYAFSIWSVICFGSILYGLYQIRTHRRNQTLYQTIEPYAVGVFIGFSAWLYAARMEWILITVGILIWMTYCLYKVYAPIVTAASQGLLSNTEYVVTYSTFGMYAGWATIAMYANIAAAMKWYGASDVGSVGIAWQAFILVSAATLALGGVRVFKGSTPYVAAVLWAFFAVLVSTVNAWPLSSVLPFITAGAIVFIGIQYSVFLRRYLQRA